MVLADLDPELQGLPIGIPTGVFGNEGWETVPLAIFCSQVRSDEGHASPGAADEVITGKAYNHNRPRSDRLKCSWGGAGRHE